MLQEVTFVKREKRDQVPLIFLDRWLNASYPASAMF